MSTPDIVGDFLERIDHRLDRIEDGQEEIKHEQVATSLQLQQLVLQQAQTNGRVGKNEDRLSVIETARAADALARAREEGLRAGAAGVLITRKQIAAGFGMVGVVLTIAATAVQLALRFLG